MQTTRCLYLHRASKRQCLDDPTAHQESFWSPSTCFPRPKRSHQRDQALALPLPSTSRSPKRSPLPPPSHPEYTPNPQTPKSLQKGEIYIYMYNPEKIRKFFKAAFGCLGPRNRAFFAFFALLMHMAIFQKRLKKDTKSSKKPKRAKNSSLLPL